MSCVCIYIFNFIVIGYILATKHIQVTTPEQKANNYNRITYIQTKMCPGSVFSPFSERIDGKVTLPGVVVPGFAANEGVA